MKASRGQACMLVIASCLLVVAGRQPVPMADAQAPAGVYVCARPTYGADLCNAARMAELTPADLRHGRYLVIDASVARRSCAACRVQVTLIDDATATQQYLNRRVFRLVMTLDRYGTGALRLRPVWQLEGHRYALRLGYDYDWQVMQGRRDIGDASFWYLAQPSVPGVD